MTPVKADLTRQWRLLDLQKLDTRLDQLGHRERTLPIQAQLTEAQAVAQRLSEDVVIARTALQDNARAVSKADADVQLVRDRADRDRKRLESGTGTAKELQNLQHELDTLARRQSELEDVELEVMERAESLQADLTAKETAQQEAAGRVETLQAEQQKALAEIVTERESVERERANVAPGVGQDLLALYEKLRDQMGGVAAAALQQKRCSGCGLELGQADLARIRAAAEDEVVRCEECRRILVRTAESGL
ncbi:MAG TPA: C4-type zinc ribbon domain-containing protein [Flexivirga sp.]|uniref:zinc ribbon domain-containing protein n=1 Tax=Flexivirga sp. TaxID=1962927 RepID=UPI002BC44084|nr:C4-type zinc ribbon domain-containing protein [Flexivirga sp.]HWC23994.1 C4-type zinc ribbon domain-containing protein [Flexivirga sp.]